MAKHFPKGLDERMRDRSGEIRKKRSDTLVSTLREEYGADFAKRRPMWDTFERQPTLFD